MEGERMVYGLFDLRQGRIVDVFESGDRNLLMQDLIELYNRVTGEKITAFPNLEEARVRTIEAVSKRYFPGGQPAEVAATVKSEVPRMGPVARAWSVFKEMKGRPRKEMIEACAAVGIKRSTAAAQYQRWKTEQDRKAAERAAKRAAKTNNDNHAMQ